LFEPHELGVLREKIRERTAADRHLLEELREEIRRLRGDVRTIKPRSTTAVSLVASDGGNNKLVFDPFLFQVIRVVDSYGKQLCFDIISPSTDTDQLSAAQFDEDGRPKTALGFLMSELGTRTLNELSPMIPPGRMIRESPETVSTSWVQVYRDLCEWAVLYERIRRGNFTTDTLIVRDGQLRSKVFRDGLFMNLRKRVEESIERIYREDRRRVFLVGIAKHTKVLTRYHLAIALESLFPPGEPRYVRVPREIEKGVYIWDEYARGTESEGEKGEAPKFVAGDMYLVRFGTRTGDPIWAVDVLSSQTPYAAEIFGYLLADAIDGFPVPLYPRCLQRAHEFAQIAGFDYDILQSEVVNAVRELVPSHQLDLFDGVRFKTDLSARRYV
jgi:hypothetical protein